jgi:hypothetical protein
MSSKFEGSAFLWESESQERHVCSTYIQTYTYERFNTNSENCIGAEMYRNGKLEIVNIGAERSCICSRGWIPCLSLNTGRGSYFPLDKATTENWWESINPFLTKVNCIAPELESLFITLNSFREAEKGGWKWKERKRFEGESIFWKSPIILSRLELTLPTPTLNI